QRCASCLKTANPGENVVPKRFRTFISTNLRDTYIFAVSKIGQTQCTLSITLQRSSSSCFPSNRRRFVSCPCKSLHISKKLRRLPGEKSYPCGESNHGKGPAFF